MRVRQLDGALALQPGQDTADRFDGQAQMIGDIGARHRQLDLQGMLRLALGQGGEKARHPLLGGLAAEHHHLVMGRGKTAAGKRQQLPGEARIALHQTPDRRARIAPDHAVDDRLAGEMVFIREVDDDDIAGREEIRHLPPAIRHQLADAHGPADDAMIGGGGIAFPEQRLIAFDRNVATELFGQFERARTLCSRARCPGRAGRRNRRGDGGVHGISPVSVAFWGE